MDRPTDKQIADVLAGIASVEEAKMVARWFATEAGSAYLASAFDRDAKTIGMGDEELYVPHTIPSEEVWTRIQKQIRRYRLRRILFRAAVVVIPLLLLAGMYKQLDERVSLFGETKYEEVYVPKGERMQIMFQDGSKVYINSDTYLRYPEKFGMKSREVELSGEAYFVKDIKGYLNFDMIGRNNRPEQPEHVVYFYTEAHPALGQWLKDDIARYGLKLQPDYRPWDRPVGGSDNASFAVHDIPIIWYHTDGHPDYHQPSDHADKLNWEKVVEITKASFLNAWNLANEKSY